MATEERRLSGAIQENILTLLCFDDKNCKLIRHALTPQLFESAVFREIAGHAIDFIDQFAEAIKDHLPDHLESILKGDDARKATSYKKVVDQLFLNRDSVNAEYVLKELRNFIRAQNLKSAFVKAAEAFDEGNVDRAELEMQKGLNTQIVTFDSGLNFSDPKQIGGILHQLEEPGFNLGIAGLDQVGIIPRRKQLMMFVAPRGRGKSWSCIHVAKMALIQRWSVAIVTLEMSEASYAGRFLQSFFSIGKREARHRIAKFVHGRDGELQEIIHEEIERITLRDPDIEKILRGKIKREFGRRPPLVIKQFPPQSLTVEGLEAWLDGLERFQNVTPDLIIVDYPMLMKHNATNKRVELGAIVEKLRGIAVARNAAMFAPWQGNRESEDATTVTGSMAGEDISVLATADVLLTYSRTTAEYKLGLARLLVDKNRNDIDKFSLLITQAYGIGQFCLDSTHLESEYWDLLEEHRPKRGGRRQEKDDD